APAAVEERQAGLSFARKRHPRPSPGVIFGDAGKLGEGALQAAALAFDRRPAQDTHQRRRNRDLGTKLLAEAVMPQTLFDKIWQTIWWRGAPMAATSSISTGTCCTSCTRPTPSSNSRSSTGTCAGRI